MSRIGLGFDAHPFADGKKLMLGGLEWEHARGLSGHSDGDVLLHAIADALLGAAGAGSLGEFYPDTDPRQKNRESADFVREVWQRLVPTHSFGNLDATVIGETPRVAPRRTELVARIAEILGVEPSRISVRGTSTNGLGFPGRGEGLAAIAVVLLESRRSSPSEGG